jgi:farnesyl diphosphate synthase
LSARPSLRADAAPAGAVHAPAPPAPESLESWMRARQQRFEALAERSLPGAASVPQRLHEAMRYAVLDGGKRIRPLLAYAAGETARADPPALDAIALALEYVHAYSLVHDDMPCMDDDVLRRGKPTVHVAFDEATAMLAGDALQAEAFRVLVGAPLAAGTRLELVQALALAAGTGGMCGGQAIDLESAGRALDARQIEAMHRMKTGALLRASVLMGARAGQLDAPALAALDSYAEAIGLAFQIVDDILDVESSAAELGKTAGKDHAQNKATYVSVLGMEPAKRRAAELRAQAGAALERSGLAAARTLRLAQLADLIVERRS